MATGLVDSLPMIGCTLASTKCASLANSEGQLVPFHQTRVSPKLGRDIPGQLSKVPSFIKRILPPMGHEFD